MDWNTIENTTLGEYFLESQSYLVPTRSPRLSIVEKELENKIAETLPGITFWDVQRIGITRERVLRNNIILCARQFQT